MHRKRIGLCCCGWLAIAVACGDAGAAGDTDTDTDTTTQGDAATGTGSATTSQGTTSSGNESGNTSTTGVSTSTSADTDPTETTSPGQTDDSSGGAATCNKPPPGAGLQTGLTLEVDGVPRSYDIFVPTSYDGTSFTPLVLNFHGLLGSPAQQMNLSRFNAVAEARGWLVAYPEGISNSFNGGLCCGTASSTGVDDVGFSRAVVEHASTALCVDSDRVYAMGMSNGGHMVHLLACQAADVFAAVASVTGVLNLAPAACQSARNISVMDFHGTSDNVVPFGGTIVGFPPVDQMMSDWAGRNGCGDVADVTFEQGDMRCETWPACGDGVEVTLCTVEGGGHCWPGSGACVFGNNSTERDASEVIADMFASQSM